MKKLCVFCGASPGKNSSHLELAKQTGRWMAQNQIALVYGGGSTGLMGALADSVLSHKGHVIGVIPHSMVEKELAHKEIQELIKVDTMHQRKFIMSEKADGFLALPGGFGTLDELNEIITWYQLQLHSKPIALLNKTQYFDLFLQFIEYASNEGFISRSHFEMLQIIQNIEEFKWNMSR